MWLFEWPQQLAYSLSVDCTYIIMFYISANMKTNWHSVDKQPTRRSTNGGDFVCTIYVSSVAENVTSWTNKFERLDWIRHLGITHVNNNQSVFEEHRFLFFWFVSRDVQYMYLNMTVLAPKNGYRLHTGEWLRTILIFLEFVIKKKNYFYWKL